MMLECVQFGELKMLQAFPIELLDGFEFKPIVQYNTIVPDPTSSSSQEIGAVLVSFQLLDSANKCARALDERWFDGRQLSAQIIIPPVGAGTDTEVNGSAFRNSNTSLEEMSVHNDDRNTSIAESKEEEEGNYYGPSGGGINNNSVEEDGDADIDGKDTEDFLNSLL